MSALTLGQKTRNAAVETKRRKSNGRVIRRTRVRVVIELSRERTSALAPYLALGGAIFDLTRLEDAARRRRGIKTEVTDLSLYLTWVSFEAVRPARLFGQVYADLRPMPLYSISRRCRPSALTTQYIMSTNLDPVYACFRRTLLESGRCGPKVGAASNFKWSSYAPSAERRVIRRALIGAHRGIQETKSGEGMDGS